MVETSTDRSFFFFFNFDVHLTSILTRDVFFLGHTFVSWVIDHSIQEELHFSFSSPSFPRIDKFIFFRLLHTNEFDITNSNNSRCEFCTFTRPINIHRDRGKQKESSFLFERIFYIHIRIHCSEISLVVVTEQHASYFTY